MKMIMISCQRATELIDKHQVVGLTTIEKMKLKLHTAMCDACGRYEKQSKVIDVLLSKVLDTSTNADHVSDENAQQLAQRILSKKR